ncbi:MAG: deoxyribodipyrimidine photolyase [Planctomycetes bacterium]|nr:deoxyribodipyrimidine photolyase [Planctomycetota bacterium]
MFEVPALRVRALVDRPWRSKGDHVVYWMTSTRRGGSNFALQHAVARATQFDVPLIVLEALRCDYPWASARLHRFVLDGMQDQRRWFEERGIAYHAYVEPEVGAGRGLIAALAARACGVVTDEFPCFFLPRMLAAAAAKLAVRLESVDSNGLLPLRAAPTDFPTAYAFRRFLQKSLAPHVQSAPLADALADVRLPSGAVPEPIAKRWPMASDELLRGAERALAALPIEARVKPVELRGGERAALSAMRGFLDRKLVDYEEQRNQPDARGTSGLSPYLHFGHIGVHQVLGELARREDWSPARIAGVTHGRKSGWWNMSSMAEAFLDELVTWRELGYVFCSRRADYASYDALPAWALETLVEHADDPRPALYSLEQFAAAHTHDALWNAAQTQLVREGSIHNYLRMLWGKKVLEWSRTPREALATLIELNNRYALDGRNPNSYSGIFWCLGRFDRPWPERKVFGKVRCMTSDSTAKKLDVSEYLARYSPPRERGLFERAE